MNPSRDCTATWFMPKGQSVTPQRVFRSKSSHSAQSQPTSMVSQYIDISIISCASLLLLHELPLSAPAELTQLRSGQYGASYSAWLSCGLLLCVQRRSIVFLLVF